MGRTVKPRTKAARVGVSLPRSWISALHAFVEPDADPAASAETCAYALLSAHADRSCLVRRTACAPCHVAHVILELERVLRFTTSSDIPTVARLFATDDFVSTMTTIRAGLAATCARLEGFARYLPARPEDLDRLVALRDAAALFEQSEANQELLESLFPDLAKEALPAKRRRPRALLRFVQETLARGGLSPRTIVELIDDGESGTLRQRLDRYRKQTRHAHAPTFSTDVWRLWEWSWRPAPKSLTVREWVLATEPCR